MSEPRPIVIADLRGGRNGTDPPLSLPMNQCVEAINVDWKDATVAHKRGGSIAFAPTGGTAFASGMQTLIRHVPGSAETEAELWGTDGAATPLTKRYTAAFGGSFANVTFDDAISTRPQDLVGASLNGKLFLAYDGFSGLTITVGPSVANQGVGTYAAVSRVYRVRWVVKTGTITVRRSAVSEATIFIPSGTGIAARVTQPTPPGLGETHWEIEVSLDAATWYVLSGDGGLASAIVIGTAFADDSTATTLYSTGALSVSTDMNDRLHVYDPKLAAPRVRRVGIHPGGVAPTAANNGGGAYAATLRYYRVRFIQYNNSIVIRRSEATPSVSFTPSGAGLNVRITRPTAPGEGETHWELEASTDNATWYVVFGVGSGAFSPVAIATTTGDDGSTSYTAYPLSDPAGTYSLFPAVKYLISDGNRLLGLNAYDGNGSNGSGKTSRLWYTPVLGSTDKSDDERVPMTTTQKNYVDLNENDGGAGTGLGGPLNGIPYLFKFRQVIKLRPTGDVSAPYLPRKIREDIGCISHKSIAIGEDQTGRAALYFMSHRGPYRVTIDGDIQYLGRDNEDIWRTINLSAATTVTHSVYYPDVHQWWVWLSTGSNDDCDTRMMFDVQLGFPDEHGQIRGGWAKHTGAAAGARCSCLFGSLIVSTTSSALKPFIGRSTGTTIFKCDTSDLDDNGTAFQAYVTTRPLLTTADLLKKAGLQESTLITKAQAATNLSVTINRDFGKETRVQTVSLAAAGSETRVTQKVGASEMGEADVVQMTIGDASALANTWTVDALITPVKTQERR